MSSVESLSRTAEKLIILLDYSQGLLTRLHGCVHFKRGEVFGNLGEKVIDHLAQKKEDPSQGISKQNGADVIQMKAEALENETRFCYETISDILRFSNEVEPLFQTIIQNIIIFDIHKNSDLTTRFLGVFFNYVRIYFLSARTTDARIACYLYMLAYKEHNRKDPDDAHLVRKFIWDNYSPLRQLQTKCRQNARIGDVLCDAIKCLQLSFATWTNYESIRQGQYFSLSQENPVKYAHPVNEKALELYQDASYLDNLGTWIIYLYLIYPEKLNDDVSRDQLIAALNDRTVVILFREELIDALHEYNVLNKTSIVDYKVPSKVISKVIKSVDLEAMTTRHRQMRELLRREIRGLLDLCQTLPGVIPVKLPILMACLALARYEVFWVFTHMSLKNSKTKLKDSFIAAPFLPDLMFYCIKLLQLILNNKDLIHEYYRDQLKLDLQELIPFVQQMRKTGRIDGSILANVDLIIEQIKELNQNANVVTSLEGLRLNWYRASADLSKEPSLLGKPEGAALVKLINPLIEHTRYYDRLEKEVDARGSMATLWFYRSFMAQIYNNYCLGKIDVEQQGKKGWQPYRQGRYWIVFLQVFSQALLNVHRQRPEELDEIGISVLKKTEAYLSGSTSKIEVCLRNVLGQHSKWNAQIQPETVAEHLIMHNGEKRGWKQLPGFESYWTNREFLNNLKYNLDIIGDMCSSFAEVDSLIIHNQRIYPSAYLHQLMHDFFYSELRLLVQETPLVMVRPSRFVSRLERLFRAVSSIGSYINLDLERMVKQILYYDFYDENVGGAGDALGMSKQRDEKTNEGKPSPNGDDSKKNEKLIHDIKDWYVGLVTSKCCQPNSGAVFSPVLNGFYDIRPNNNPLEDYCSIIELENLCKIIGPSGVRVIDFEVVKIAHAAMSKIDKTMRDNKDLIMGVEMDKFYGEERWKNFTNRFKGFDVISKQGTIIGSVILFRKLLREALQNVIKQRVGFYVDAVKMVHDRLLEEGSYHEDFSNYALDVGIYSNFSDNVMRNVLYQFHKPDAKIYTYIPLVFGVCFSDAFWTNNDVHYNMRTGALSNNGFALGNCVETLISIFSDRNQHRPQKLRYLDIAGKSLLYMKKLQYNNPAINHLFLYLDYFVNISHDLSPNDLQAVSVPYDVIRAQLVKAYGDASGLFSESQLAVQQLEDDIKDDD